MIIIPGVFVLSMTILDEDIWDSIKLTVAVALGIAFIGVGAILMTDGGLRPL